jgi:chromosome segregation ATPase
MATISDRGLTINATDATQLGSTLGGGGLSSTMGGGTGPAVGSQKPGHSEAIKANNVKRYQDQNKEVMALLSKLEEDRDEQFAKVAKWDQRKTEVEAEWEQRKRTLSQVEATCEQKAAEIQSRDEMIRTFSHQNRELLDMLDQTEQAVKQLEENVKDLTGKQAALQSISDEYDNIKETGNRQLATAFSEIAKYEEELRNAQNECEQLKETDATFQAQAQADIQELEKKLKESKDQNVGHLQQIQHNEVHEHRMGEAMVKLKELLDELSTQKKGIRMQLDVDVEHRDKWQQSKAEVERRKETLEKTVEALRMSLRSAEEHNAKMQQDNKHGADNFRQLGDKVYSLMDQLRVNQLDLKKQETAGVEKAKKISVLDKQANTLQQDLQAEVDNKLQAEAEARGAAQMQALLQKKNKMLTEAEQLARKAEEKVKKRLTELHEKANSLSTQNEYLGTRIEGNEEDKGALKYELRRLEEELRQTTAVHTQLAQHRIELEDKANDLEAEKTSVSAELDYIKREDMLDETGRTKPILIESESKLIDRLQVNEFLFSAQQTKNPVKMLVEKVSHLLELLHTAQTQSDLYLQDLQRSNTMLTALRSKNMTLYEKVQLCETWKMRALLKIVSNAFESRQNVKGHTQAKHRGQVLYLDGLQYTNKELKELIRVVTSYEKQDVVREIRLQENSLARPSVPCLIDILNLCPYLGILNLKRNKLDEDSISELQTFIERIPGVTAVVRDPVTGDIIAKSGHQLRSRSSWRTKNRQMKRVRHLTQQQAIISWRTRAVLQQMLSWLRHQGSTHSVYRVLTRKVTLPDRVVNHEH